MGIDARLETEGAESLVEIGDPRSYLAWSLGSSANDSTSCLKFIDPYGNTVFNQGQLPILLAELEAVRASLDEQRLESAKKQYLTQARSWPKEALAGADAYTHSFSLTDVGRQLDDVIALVRNGINRGPHHYVRFIGD